jgi:hypothetical protein
MGKLIMTLEEEEIIHIHSINLSDGTNMYNTVQILYDEMELIDYFSIPPESDEHILFGYNAIKRRLKLK